MGAALHLAEVHQAPPGPKRKRKGGGGGGSEFYEYAQRIYSDTRADSDARELLLAFAYAVVTIQDDGQAQWDLVRQALGRGRSYRPRLQQLIEQDLPRYLPPDRQEASPENLLRVCSAPRLRAFRSRPWPGATAKDIADQARRDEKDVRNTHMICGNSTSDYAIEKMPATGWHRLHYFCPAHRDHLTRIRKQVAEQNAVAPPPIPNAGGLLPSYFDADWEKVYRHYAGGRWELPVYGLRADDWPIPGREIVAPRARLRLAALDGELLGGGS